METILKRSYWAYLLLFLNFNINLGSITIPLLPNFLGWYFLLKVIGELAEDAPSLELLANPARILLAISLTEFVPGIATEYPTLNLIVSLFGNLLALYFHFQFLTNLADLLATQGHDILPLYRCRTVLTIATTISAFTPLVGVQWMAIPLFINVVAGLMIADRLRRYALESNRFS